MTHIFIAKIVRDKIPKIKVDEFEILAKQHGSLVIKNDNDVRLFQQKYIGQSDTTKERYQEEGYGKTPEEAVEALRQGLQSKSAILMSLAQTIYSESKLPYVESTNSKETPKKSKKSSS